jgi:phage portal protein, HK97 family
MGLFSKRQVTPGAPIDSPRGSRIQAAGPKVRTATDGRDVLLNTPDGWEVDQPWLWFTGPAGGGLGPFGNPLVPSDGDPFGLSNQAGVSRCTSIICDTISGLPWKVFRGEYTELPTPAWLIDPQSTRVDGRVVDPGQVWEARLSAVEFWANWICAALWFGDGYVYAPVRDSNGQPQPPLWQLHPADVVIDGGDYWVSDVRLSPGSVIHLRGLLPYWDGHGHGVITTHGPELALAATVRTYAAGVFNSGVPAGYLKSSAPTMTPDDAMKLKATWLAQHGGAKRSIAILNATTEFHPISISPVDAQLTSSREWSLRDIALAFGLPAYMLGIAGDNSTYANVESRMIELNQFTLLPWIRRIESVLDSEFPAGTSLKIRTQGLLRADTKSRNESYKLALDAGWLTVDEVRALEDLPPLVSEGVA